MHATQDEEARIYPMLKQALDANRNAALTAAYQREFQSVMPDKTNVGNV